ncbi:MAG: prepilin-type N-terminal cleavage/methylation domain-containing protein [Candidatus Omnitrophica bacterium]|nr:prepilin-type N-terminal cleavage/methylation domain-containing protein [Candidatus Omnitrophota bacterium]
MPNKGMTFIELIVALVISGFVVLIMTCLFVSEFVFQNQIADQGAATTEAGMAMHYMARVLRYAVPSSPVTITDNANVTSVTATIGSGYLDEITSNTAVTFSRIKTGGTANNFTYKIGAAAASTIATGITSFSSSYDSVNKELFLQVTATKNTRSSLLETKVHLLGDKEVW